MQIPELQIPELQIHQLQIHARGTMDALTVWIVILGLAAVTIVTRSLFVVIGDRVQLPPRVQHALRYAPVCALVALITPELFAGAPQGIDYAKLFAGIAAALTMLMTRNTLYTIAIGMGVFTLVRLY